MRPARRSGAGQDQARQARCHRDSYPRHSLRREHARPEGAQLSRRTELRGASVRRGPARCVHGNLPGRPGFRRLYRDAALIFRPQGAGRPERRGQGCQGEVRRLLCDLSRRMGLRLRFRGGEAPHSASGQQPQGLRRGKVSARDMLGRSLARLSRTDPAFRPQEHLLHLQNRRGQVRLDGSVHDTQS